MSAVDLHEARDAAHYGGKAAQLQLALAHGLPVPPGAALGWSAVQGFSPDDHALLTTLAGRVRLSLGVAVRSSGIGEDSESASFAGQHLTVLGVRSAPALAAAIQRVRESAAGSGAVEYRRKLGLDPTPRIGVVVQQLVHADVAGVLFSRDPMTGEDVRVIEASWGLGEAVVAGIVTPDRYRVARGGAVRRREAGEKDVAIRWAPDDEDTVEVAVEPARVHALCLDDRRLAQLDALATRCEAVFGGTQDLEFAFEGDQIFLLQRRAITRGG